MTGAVEEESALIAGLRTGDERAFAQLVRPIWTARCCGSARGYSCREVAEEVVQQARAEVLKGILQFEGRSSFAYLDFHGNDRYREATRGPRAS